MSPSLPAAASGRRRAYRLPGDGLLGGVAAGLAEHLRLPVMWVRVGFLLTAALSGFGAVLYAGLWMVLPEAPRFDDSAPGLAAATRQGRRPRRRRSLADYGGLVAVGAIAAGVLLLVTTVTGRALVVWPLLLGVAGVAVLWRQADRAQQERWTAGTVLSPLQALLGTGGWSAWARLGAGGLLLVAAITTFSLRTGSWTTALNIGLAAVLGVLGIAFIAGPWLLRLSSDLSEERAERIRSQERADVAAHLHDSVLQTLALIQKAAADPATVTRLARAQERDLRGWLYGETADADTTVAGAIRAAVAGVEDDTGVPVEVVAVGDAPLTGGTRPVVLATREAVLNAAWHSGAAKVDVYLEITGERIEVFVRDRGIGFDPGAVAADRHGVRDSIVERMRRHGGSAELRSVPGSGTEVRLALPVVPEKAEEDA
jgi:signal transduction histidine kinase